MSVSFRLGLVHDELLTRDELRAVLAITGGGVIEPLDGAFVNLWRSTDGSVEEDEADPGSVPSLRKFFARGGGSVDSEVAATVELCALIPGDVLPTYTIARGVAGIAGLRFKGLATALGELSGLRDETGDDSLDEVIRLLTRAEELGVAVVFGERSSA